MDRFPVYFFSIVAAIILFFVVDATSSNQYYAVSNIVEKKHTEASSTLVWSGDTFITVYTPESWSVVVDKYGSSSVSQEEYEILKYGDEIPIQCTVGRITGYVYSSMLRIEKFSKDEK